MTISIIVVKILGIYLVVSGFFLIFKGKTVPYLLKDFYNHPAIVYLTGVILVFLSSLFLLQNNIWDGTWYTAITILVWGVLLKGLSYIFIPEMMYKMVDKKLLASLGVYGFFTIIVGLLLLTLG